MGRTGRHDDAIELLDYLTLTGMLAGNTATGTEGLGTTLSAGYGATFFRNPSAPSKRHRYTSAMPPVPRSVTMM